MTAPSGQYKHRWALAAVSMGIFCIQLDAFALNPALLHVGHDLHALTGELQWTVSAYLLAAGTLMLGAGRMSDLFGRRRLLVIGLSLFGAASLLCAMSPSLAVLVSARVAQGAGSALIMPAGLALLTNVFSPEHRRRATGYAIGIGNIATACGPFVGGTLAQMVSWRAIFWINAPIAVLAAMWAYRAQESRDTSVAAKLDGKGLALVTTALATLVVFIDRVQEWGWTSGTSAAVLVLFMALMVAFVWHEHRTLSPLVEMALFRNAPYVALTAAGAVANTATVVFMFVVPLSLQRLWGLSSGAAGIAFLAPAALMAVAGPVAGHTRSSRAVMVMAVCLGSAAAMLCAASVVGALPVYLLVITACGAVLGVASVLALVATQAVIRPQRAGEAAGVTKTIVTIAAGLGVVLCGPAASQAPGLASESAAGTTLVLTGVGCLATCLLLSFWMLSRRAAAPERIET